MFADAQLVTAEINMKGKQDSRDKGREPIAKRHRVQDKRWYGCCDSGPPLKTYQVHGSKRRNQVSLIFFLAFPFRVGEPRRYRLTHSLISSVAVSKSVRVVRFTRCVIAVVSTPQIVTILVCVRKVVDTGGSDDGEAVGVVPYIHIPVRTK